jgi:hypothetical protein
LTISSRILTVWNSSTRRAENRMGVKRSEQLQFTKQRRQPPAAAFFQNYNRVTITYPAALSLLYVLHSRFIYNSLVITKSLPGGLMPQNTARHLKRRFSQARRTLAASRNVRRKRSKQRLTTLFSFMAHARDAAEAANAPGPPGATTDATGAETPPLLPGRHSRGACFGLSDFFQTNQNAGRPPSPRRSREAEVSEIPSKARY